MVSARAVGLTPNPNIGEMRCVNFVYRVFRALKPYKYGHMCVSKMESCSWCLTTSVRSHEGANVS